MRLHDRIIAARPTFIHVLRWVGPIEGFDPLPYYATPMGADMMPRDGDESYSERDNVLPVVCMASDVGITIKESRGRHAAPKDEVITNPARYRVLVRAKVCPPILITKTGIRKPPPGYMQSSPWEDLGEYRGNVSLRVPQIPNRLEVAIVPVHCEEWATELGWYRFLVDAHGLDSLEN